MKPAIFALLLLTTTLTVDADSGLLGTPRSFLSANQLHDDCNSQNNFDRGFCSGYIIATSDMANGLKGINVCIPAAVTIEEAVDIAKKYMTDNPAERHYSAYSTVIASLGKVFPCPKSPPVPPSTKPD